MPRVHAAQPNHCFCLVCCVMPLAGLWCQILLCSFKTNARLSHISTKPSSTTAAAAAAPTGSTTFMTGHKNITTSSSSSGTHGAHHRQRAHHIRSQRESKTTSSSSSGTHKVHYRQRMHHIRSQGTTNPQEDVKEEEEKKKHSRGPPLPACAQLQAPAAPAAPQQGCHSCGPALQRC